MAKRAGRDRDRDTGQSGTKDQQGDRPNRKLVKALGKVERRLDKARGTEARRLRQLDEAAAEVARLEAELRRIQAELAGESTSDGATRRPAAATPVPEGLAAELARLERRRPPAAVRAEAGAEDAPAASGEADEADDANAGRDSGGDGGGTLLAGELESAAQLPPEASVPELDAAPPEASESVIHLGSGTGTERDGDGDAHLDVTSETGRAEPGAAPEPRARSWPQRGRQRSSS